MKRIVSYSLIAFPLAGCLALAAVPEAHAYTYQHTADIVVGQTNPKTIKAFGGTFKGGASVAAADVIGDEAIEVVTGAGHGGGPQVEIYSQSGARKSSFFVFDQKTMAGLFVGAADIDGLGSAEIIVGPASGREPEVGVYTGRGKKLFSFFAYEKKYTGGVRVAGLPAGHGTSGLIATASGPGRAAQVRVYDASGKNLYWTFFPFGETYQGGAALAGGWSPSLNRQLLVVGSGTGRSTLVKIYDVAAKTLIYEWQPFASEIKTGVSVAISGDTVVVAPGTDGGPEVRLFSLSGEFQSSYFAYSKNFRGGVMVAAADRNGAVVPIAAPITLDALDLVARSGKKIVISLSRQELRMYQHGKIISTRKISAGKWTTPTPTGEFKTKNKISVAYSKPYDLYMEYWMAFTPDGSYGLHALPYWKTRSGGKLYEGASHIGRPASHGCIRQTLADAKSLYAWAPIGTPVTILK